MQVPKTLIYTHLPVVTLFCASSCMASPLVSIGDSTNLYFNGNTRATYNSNLFLQDDQLSPTDDQVEDVSFEFTPGFQLQVGRPGSDFTVAAYVNETFKLYADNDDLNNELFSSGVHSRYSNDVLEVTIGLDYNEDDQAIRDFTTGGGAPVGALIERSTSDAKLGFSYRFTPKTSVEVGAEFNNRDYDSDQSELIRRDPGLGPLFVTDSSDPNRIRNDQEQFTIPVNFYYAWRPKLDVGLGYRYRQTTVKDSLGLVSNPFSGVQSSTVLREGVDTRDHFFSANFRGEFTPKLKGSIKAGIQLRERYGVEIDQSVANNPNYDPDTVDFSMDASLTYVFNPKSRLDASVSVDNRTSSVGTDAEYTSFDLDYAYKISPLITLGAMGRVEFEEFGTTATNSLGAREDQYARAGAYIRYSPLRSNYYVSASYTYDVNNSRTDGQNHNFGSFNRSIFGLSAGFRY